MFHFFADRMTKKWLKNTIILLVAPFCALGIFYLTRDMSGLTASVLDILELQYFHEQDWELAYKIKNQSFELFGSEGVRHADKLWFEVLYDPQHLQLAWDHVVIDYYLLQHVSTGVVNITMQHMADLPLESSRFELPFSGDQRYLLLGQASAQFGNEWRALRVGNLNQFALDHSL